MRKKITVLALSAILFALCLPAQAQQPKRIPQIGYLSYGSAEIDKSLLAALQQGLQELRYLGEVETSSSSSDTQQDDLKSSPNC